MGGGSVYVRSFFCSRVFVAKIRPAFVDVSASAQAM